MKKRYFLVGVPTLSMLALSTLTGCGGAPFVEDGVLPPTIHPTGSLNNIAEPGESGNEAHETAALIFSDLFSNVLQMTTFLSAPNALPGTSLVNDNPITVSGIRVSPGPKPCRYGGEIELHAVNEYIDEQGMPATPTDYTFFGEYNIFADVDMEYRQCATPIYLSYESDTPEPELDEFGDPVIRVVNGNFRGVYNTNPRVYENPQTGVQTRGYDLVSELMTRGFSIQKGESLPRNLDSHTILTMSTQDIESDVFATTIHSVFYVQDADQGGFAKATMDIRGERDLAYSQYSFNVEGTLNTYSSDNDGVVFYSTEPLVQTREHGGEMPLAGKIVFEKGHEKITITFRDDGFDQEVENLIGEGESTL